MWTVEALRAVEAARITDEYSPQVFPLLAKHRIEALIGDFGATAIEEPANSVIILRSASEEALRAPPTHPEYADGEMLRHSITSNATMITARRSGRSADQIWNRQPAHVGSHMSPRSQACLSRAPHSGQQG